MVWPDIEISQSLIVKNSKKRINFNIDELQMYGDFLGS